MRRELLLLLALTFVMGCTEKQESVEERAARIHAEALTIDTHTDTPMWLLRDDFSLCNPLPEQKNCVDFVKMKDGGLDVVFLANFVGQGPCDEAGYAKAHAHATRVFDSIDAAMLACSEVAEVALSSEDIMRITESGKKVVVMSTENGYSLAHEVENVAAFYKRGVRCMGLCHSWNNNICDSSSDTISQFDGLSAYGEELVAEMNRLGIIIDVSHASDSTFYDVLRISKTPIIASHSCARAVCNTDRNLTDDMLRSLAENGGVIQLCILSRYIKETAPNPQRDSAFAALREKYQGYRDLPDSVMNLARIAWQNTNGAFPPNRATVSDCVDHIDHIVQCVGIDHIGIGTDFDGGGGLADCKNTSELPNITKELVKRGYTDDEIKKLWGENTIRVMKEVEKHARQQ